ncbi:hypothetical protein HanIR_Chr07g0336841 [Helianthus annuus]|nr:hypothetical protein HanIR_Chr07g0336841 [Helianthus annuus]
MSGRVKVRYCSAPARLRYVVGSSKEGPDELLSLDWVCTGVAAGLQESIPAC